jgi:hypothetical protein
MTKDEIIELARQAGFERLGHTAEDWVCHLEDIEEFAKLVAKRTWVGLTDEEIKAFDTWHDNREEEIGWVNPSEIVAYIEAKLKQKNGYAEEKNT